MSQVTGTQIWRFNGNIQSGENVVADRVVGGGHLQFLARHCGNLPCNAQDALAVRTVRCNKNIENIVVHADNFADICSRNRILRQIHEAVDLRAGIQVVVQAQFLTGAKHTVRRNPLQGLGFDGDSAGQRGIVQRGRRMHARVDIRRAGHDLDRVAVGTAVHLADLQVCAFHRFAGEYLTHDHAADLLPQVDQLFHFKTAAEQLFSQFFRRNINIHIFLQPAVRYFHLLSPLLCIIIP